MSAIVTLLSDFGLHDSYVAEMKASVLSTCPHAILVDISHEIEKFDIKAGAFVLATAAKSFPKGTVHLAVVDPGVGSERRPIIVESGRGYYVGPDNGILMLAARSYGVRSVYQIETKCLSRKACSATFHGRDTFGPIAGLLASGVNASRLGRRIYDCSEGTLPRLRLTEDYLESEVIHIDDFGNVIVGAAREELEKTGLGGSIRLRYGRHRPRCLRVVRTYSELKGGSLGCLIGSHGFLEIAKNMGSACQTLHIRVGDRVSILLDR